MRIAELLVNGKSVAPVLLAERYAERLRGMLGRKPLPPAMLIRPCSSVHSWWMSSSIDVALLDGDGRVLKTRTMNPWSYFGNRRATMVLEAPATSFDRWHLEVGSVVSWAGTEER